LTSHYNHVRQIPLIEGIEEGRKTISERRRILKSAMVEIKTFEIKNKLGLHARVAAKLVNVSTRFKSKIFFERDGRVVNGKSLLSILTLACPLGSRITIRAEGIDAREAMEDLRKLIEDKFGED
jgi:phosphocarrier protein HPr